MMQAHSKATASSKSSVLIVGPGPAGSTRAIDRPQRRLEVTVVETRSDHALLLVRTNQHVAWRDDAVPTVRRR